MGNGSSDIYNEINNRCIDLSRSLSREELKQHLIAPSSECLHSLPLRDESTLLPIEKLDVTFNAIQSIPNDLTTFMPHLEYLLLDYNQLQELPANIGDLSHLLELSLSNNNITSLPLSLYSLTRLKKLDLSHNEITKIEPGISSLRDLERLNLTNNQLCTLPSELGRCTALYCLLVRENPVEFPPCVRDLSSASVLGFLRSGCLVTETTLEFKRICDNVVLEPTSPLVRYMLTETDTQHATQSQRTPLKRSASDSLLAVGDLRDRITGLIYGCAIGSSIGLCTDHLTSDTCTFHYGLDGQELLISRRYKDKYRMQASDWSTDFEQMLLILDSLINWSGVIDELDFAERLTSWSRHDGHYDDLDHVTQKVLDVDNYPSLPIAVSRQYYECCSHDRRHLHNGSIVRSSIIGAIQFNSPAEVVENSSRVSRSSHSHDLVVVCNRVVSCIVAYILQGKTDVEEIIDKAKQDSLNNIELNKYDKKLFLSTFDENKENIDDYEESILNSLSVCIDSLRKKENYQSIITRIAIKGGQSANHCSIVGALIGCLQGFKSLPCLWYNELSPRCKIILQTKTNLFLDLFGLP